ncbi:PATHOGENESIS-RELATED 3, basic chitinase [Hibiscus trionum]|uniref:PATHOGENESIS-RELATED 3, basic chitinase n=1 Tax=Hibiscus trionum TaxID=183268 RepID=A0A9W7LRC9_HIBTR|nr:PATHOGENESIS-RELATED 3, basic chitinase [Hibiscus trionum]
MSFLQALSILPLLLSYLIIGSAEQCGRQAGGALCPGGLCCSRYGWCGNTKPYCKDGCQSQCTPVDPSPEPLGGGLTGLISRDLFNQMLLHRNDGTCPARNFYTYDAFIAAASSYPAFATTGDQATQKREIAAFLAQTSHETTGGWPTAPDGPYTWGYCYNRELNPTSSFCAPSSTNPCAPGKQYFGRGPIQLFWNFNYGPCGRAIGADLLNNPDLLTSDATISFKSAFWFWMTPQPRKPSCHDVVVGAWTPSSRDQAEGRVPGYGAVTNIINGGLECGKGWNAQAEDRIGFYKRYCDILGVGYGDNLDCYNQRPFGNGVWVDFM